MLRVIIKHEHKDSCNGLESEDFETIDILAPEIEQALRSGGYSESGYSYRSVVGVELIDDEPAQTGRAEIGEKNEI